LTLGVPLAASVEAVFLTFYVWWASGGGPPRSARHAQRLAWLAVVVSATSAGICEETGFRGYMQRPIEQRHGVPTAIVVSSLLFMLLHLTKGWALVGMVPIVFGAGVLLGLLAWSSDSLIPGMIGHTVMDIGLFGYWWTGIAGDFVARPISETGIDQPFLITCATLATTLLIVLLAIWQLRLITRFQSRRTSASSTAV
jgi:membrane protease YdiL (CAAX protease family)